VQLESGGADFAESLPQLHPDEEIRVGDVVGVSQGRVTRRTSEAEHLLVVTDRAIVVGNHAANQDHQPAQTVALVGQVPTRVRGAVQAGDYIVPSGLNDGTGVAIAPEAVLRREDSASIVGRAWESSSDEAVKLINTAVGIPSSLPTDCLVAAIRDQQAKIHSLEARLEQLRGGKQPEKENDE
jgi:hypothetical protein